MRGRRGGFIGSQPQSGGVWRASDVLTLQRLSAWPNNTISASASPAYLDVTLTGGGQISGSVSSPYPSTTYRWEKSVDDGASWSTVSGETGVSLSLAGLTASNDGDLYRIVGVSGVRQGVSSPVEIRRETEISITFSGQPQNSAAFAGETVTIFAFASAYGETYSGWYEVQYQWQMSSDGGATWSDISGATQYLIEFATTAGMNGRKYRVRASAAGESAYSSAMTLTVNSIQVTVSPELANMTNTGTATFEATYATSLANPVLYWERSTNNGVTWSSITGNELNSQQQPMFTLEANRLILNGMGKASDHWRYRAVVFAGGSTTASSYVRADWEEVDIIFSVSPQDVSGEVGDEVQLNAEVYAVGKTTGSVYIDGAQYSWATYDYDSSMNGWGWRTIDSWWGYTSNSGKTLNVTIQAIWPERPQHRRLFRVLALIAGSSDWSPPARTYSTND